VYRPGGTGGSANHVSPVAGGVPAVLLLPLSAPAYFAGAPWPVLTALAAMAMGCVIYLEHQRLAARRELSARAVDRTPAHRIAEVVSSLNGHAAPPRTAAVGTARCGSPCERCSWQSVRAGSGGVPRESTTSPHKLGDGR
jgi:hypothetical protein